MGGKQQTSTFLKLSAETIEQGVGYVQTLTINTRESPSGVFIVKFKHNLHFYLVFLLLPLNR